MRQPELHAIEVRGMTRAAFILRGALAAGALYGAGAVAPYVSRAFAQEGGDVEVLGFALGIEQVQAEFYERAAKGAGLSGEVKQLATAFAEHETAHRDTLRTTLQQLGGEAPSAPSTRLSAGGGDFASIAASLEDTVVGAYNGAIPSATTPDVVAALASIVGTEARHAAALRFHAGDDPAPEAFDRALRRSQAEGALNRAGS